MGMGMTETTAEAAVLAETVGAVLAGGQSRRMGQPKAALEIGGEPLLRRVVGRLRDVLPNVLVVGPGELAPLVPGAIVIPDARPASAGPLAGLETALRYLAGLPGAPYRQAFVVACDMPFVAPALVRAMVLFAATETHAAEAVVLGGARGPEPLHAVYRLAVLRDVTALLDAGERSMGALLARVRVAEFPTEVAAALDPTGRSAFNANSPEEWDAALALAQAERLHGQ